jgi:hypothetical protein
MATRKSASDDTPAVEPEREETETAPAEPEATIVVPVLGLDGMPIPADAPETTLITDPESGAVVRVPADYAPVPNGDETA